MKLPGYCTVCRKVTRVQVSGTGMSALARTGTAQGTCARCRQAEDDARRGGESRTRPRR